MKDLGLTFGNVIAFLLPGFLALWAIAHFDPVSAQWVGTLAMQQATVGAFLFVVLASLGVGLVLSGFRWLLFDNVLMRRLGVPEREDGLDRNYRPEMRERLDQLTENHYKFYLFYGNTAVGLLVAAVAVSPSVPWTGWLGFAVTEVVMVASACDCLKKTRRRTQDLYAGPARVAAGGR